MDKSTLLMFVVYKKYIKLQYILLNIKSAQNKVLVK